MAWIQNNWNSFFSSKNWFPCSHNFSYSCVAAPIQYAAIAMMDTVVLNDCAYVRKASIILCAISNFLTKRFNEYGVKCHNAESAFYLLPDFDILRSEKIKCGQDLTNALMKEAQIAMVEAGPCFGRPETELTCRLAYIDFDGGYLCGVEKEKTKQIFIRTNFSRRNK